MTEFTPPLLDADSAKLPPMTDPGADRREADTSLRGARPRSESGTVLASLQEIREILRNSERHSGEDAAQPKGEPGILIRSAPTVDEPRKEGTAAPSAHAFTPPAAPPYRRNGAARTALAVAGLALFGVMGLIAVRGTDLAHRAASASGKRASRADNRPATVASAALPPARAVAVAKGDAARVPTAPPKPPAASLGSTAARWTNPPPEPTAAPVSPPAPHARAAAQPAGGDLAQPAVAVTQWGFRSGNSEIASASEPVPAGRPLILRIVFDGNLATAEQIRIRGGIAIEVRWTRETSDTAPGAPNLVTRLTIGNRGLADSLAAEARRTGFFVWHSWAEKRSLSPGTWNVSVTYPNGQPLACGNPPAPCRFHIAVG
jgi:hypothetical protein